jgi:hypothetical protein
MSLDTLVMFTGGVIAILPLLGFPLAWDRPVFFILGICVIVLGVVVRRRLHSFERPVSDVPPADVQ